MRGVLLSEVEEPHPDSLNKYLESKMDEYAVRSAVDLLSITVIGEEGTDTTKIDSMPYDLLAASYGSRYAGFIFNLPLNELSQPIRNGENLVQFKVLNYYSDESLGIDSIRLYEDYKYLKSQNAIGDAMDEYAEKFDIIIE